MPTPPVEPTPFPDDESFLEAPELAQEASYFAASASISSLDRVFMRTRCSSDHLFQEGLSLECRKSVDSGVFLWNFRG